MSVTAMNPPRRHAESLDQRLRRVVDLHFHPRDGSAFWIERAAALGVKARDVRSIDDLALLGDLSPDDLRARPLIDYIPRALHDELDHFMVGQTGGATGRGTWTAYRHDEFLEAFVDPFVAAAEHVGFPRRQQWLFVGPSGPHIIGKVVPHLARAMQSPDAFGVDFDPRWARKLPDSSFARQRYLQHIVDQAMDVIASQAVGVLFATPAVLDALGAHMTQAQRERIAGVHYGGMALSRESLDRFQTQMFPNAVHLSGYGNTLMGCCLELSAEANRQLDYFPHGSRLLLEVIDDAGIALPAGGTGQVRLTRLDESMLIVRLRERDQATALPPPTDPPDGFVSPGVRDPQARQSLASTVATGLY